MIATARVTPDGPEHMSPIDAVYEVHTVVDGDGTHYIALYDGEADPMALVAAAPLFTHDAFDERARALRAESIGTQA
jgi:hypothetical protein